MDEQHEHDLQRSSIEQGAHPRVAETYLLQKCGIVHSGAVSVDNGH